MTPPTTTIRFASWTITSAFAACVLFSAARSCAGEAACPRPSSDADVVFAAAGECVAVPIVCLRLILLPDSSAPSLEATAVAWMGVGVLRAAIYIALTMLHNYSISNHVFLAASIVALLRTEAVAIASAPAQWPKRLLCGGALGTTLLYIFFVVCNTALYFHTPWQSCMGLLVGSVLFEGVVEAWMQLVTRTPKTPNLAGVSLLRVQ